MPATVLVLIENFNAYLPRLEALGFELILAERPLPGPGRSPTTPGRSTPC